MSLKLGYVGLGGIANRHLNYGSKRDDVEIVGHADVDITRAQAAAEKFGGQAYDNATKLFDAEKPDAIVICTPPFAHGEIEEEAAKRGIHFFVEKPVAISLAMAKRVKDAVDKYGVLTQVGYMMRFAKGCIKVKQLLQGRKIAMVQEHYYMPGMPRGKWWPTIGKSGGQLVEQATHMLDLGRFLAGDVLSVSGRTARAHDWSPSANPPQAEQGLLSAAEGVTIPDTTALTMEYDSGALGTLSCSMIPQAKWDNGFRVIAEGLFIAIDNGTATWAGDEEGTEAAGDDWPSYVLYDFLDAVIQGRKETTVPYVEGVKSLAISLAGYASVDKGGAPVDVPQLMKDAGLC